MRDVYQVGDYYAAIIGIRRINVKDVGKLIDKARKALPEAVLMQAVRADSVFGVEHVVNAIRIALESQKRKLLLADKLEVDLMLRIACIDQISLALDEIGLMYGRPACLILFSTQKRKLVLAAKNIPQTFSESNNSVLKPNKKKRKLISKRLGLDLTNYLQSEDAFTDFLSERAALLNR